MFNCFLNVERKVPISVGMQHLIQLPAFPNKLYSVSRHGLLKIGKKKFFYLHCFSDISLRIKFEFSKVNDELLKKRMKIN